MKKLLVLLLALVMVISCASLAMAEEKKDLDIRVLVWKFDDAYGSMVRAGMEEWFPKYAEELGLNISYQMYDAADDMAKQIEQATILVGENPDFIIINLAEVSNGQVLTDMFTEAGIPFLFYNKPPNPDTTKAVLEDTGAIFIGTLAREAGDMQGEILAELYANDPSIDKSGDGVLQYIMLMGEPTNEEAIGRSKYSVETAEANGVKLEQLGETYVCNWDQAQATDAITAAFASFGDQIEVIFANNDMMGLGAIAALNSYGYNTGIDGDPEIVIIGVDAVDAALEAIKDGTMTATVKQDGHAMGKANVRLAINGALGKEWLDGTDYVYQDLPYYCIYIPYAKITE